MHRTWLPSTILVVSSLVGDALTRTHANSFDRERQLQAATEAIRNLPPTVGPWRSVAGEPISQNAQRTLQCRAHASLSFMNDETGERVSVVLMAGTAGPMVAHTPEVCYESGSFDMPEAARAESISSLDGLADTFERVTFRPKSGGPALQRIYHAWRKAQGRWEAPRNPRLVLGGEAMLYKLQLATSIPEKSADEPAGSDACRRLLEALIPVLDQAMNKQ